jgi:chemosensory pili system protein ChpA (sensor histidine kinase/response regulator)
MDVVHNEVKQLGGSITAETERGVGTTFIIRLPLTLSITQALMVYVADQIFAIPLASVVNILEVPIEKLNSTSMGEKPLLHHEDQAYPFMHLGSRLGFLGPARGNKAPVLLAKSGAREIAIQVDGLGGTREVVIKSLGPQLSEIKGMAGATILGDGRVVLILDIGGLWISDEAMRVVRAHKTAERAESERSRPLIMVVDDSLTVRKITSRHLQKQGMDVMVAKDGLDAVEQLRQQIPDVMLVDIEMPRMDGYELTTNVRSDPTLRHIPIIMITSRAGAKHKDRAMQLGVDLYMSKPYQEDDLLRGIEAMLTRRTIH